MISLFD